MPRLLPLFFLIPGLSLGACVARPNGDLRRNDHLEETREGLPVEGVSQPIVSNEAVSGGAAPTDTLTSEDASLSRVLASEEPPTTVSPEPNPLEEDSGSGVNNGAGPTGTFLNCTGKNATLSLSGTAAVGLISGSLKIAERTITIYCHDGERDESYTCNDFDLGIRFSIHKASESQFRATVREFPGDDPEGQKLVDLTCTRPTRK